MSEGGFPELRGDMERVIRRLNTLELLILLAAVFFAIGGGALVAFLVSSGTNLPFRATWALLSLLLFVVPGLAVLGRERRTNTRRERDSRTPPTDGA